MRSYTWWPIPIMVWPCSKVNCIQYAQGWGNNIHDCLTGTREVRHHWHCHVCTMPLFNSLAHGKVASISDVKSPNILRNKFLCSQRNATEHLWWWVSIGSGIGWSRQPIITQFTDAYVRRLNDGFIAARLHRMSYMPFFPDAPLQLR